MEKGELKQGLHESILAVRRGVAPLCSTQGENEKGRTETSFTRVDRFRVSILRDIASLQ
jgi:hypothetical protein